MSTTAKKKEEIIIGSVSSYDREEKENPNDKRPSIEVNIMEQLQFPQKIKKKKTMVDK